MGYKDQFASQSLALKAEYVKEQGTLLMGRVGELFIYSLYDVNGFYVEIAYDFIEKKIVGIDAFYDTNRLESYLKRIKIE